MEIITSKDNQIVKKIRALRDKKGRMAFGAFLVEGAKFVAEIGEGWAILHVVVSESFAAANDVPSGAIVVTDRVFATMSDVASPQGILAMVAQRELALGDIPRGGVIFVLENINDPGNLGTILRNCHGLGAAGVVLSRDCVDIFSPKVIRASAGSIFHVPFVMTDLTDAIAFLRGEGILVYATAADGERTIFEVDFGPCPAFVLGSEHHGVSPQIRALADGVARIPTVSESLNVSVACAVIAYENLRRKFYEQSTS